MQLSGKADCTYMHKHMQGTPSRYKRNLEVPQFFSNVLRKPVLLQLPVYTTAARSRHALPSTCAAH
jgi:hypothetical protein